MNKIPDYKVDYTNVAREVYDIAKYKGYKFLKGRTLDAWLQYGWSILFERKMNDHDLRVLQHFLKKRDNIIFKREKLNLKLNYEEREFQNRYIGKDGYIYMNKMIYPLEKVNPKKQKDLKHF